MSVNKTQIDRLGDRLRGGSHTESDLRLLAGYRRSFAKAYEVVIRTLRQRGTDPTGRPAKSTVSIVEKLRRESIRLSQMQDIAGCRVVIENVAGQDQLVASLRSDFPGASVMDRRDNPSNGYRAVHIVAQISGKPIEIQVRTSLQHLWAEVSEKSSDVLDPAIKYGGGPKIWRSFLETSSTSVAAYEDCEREFFVFAATKDAADAAHEKFERAVAELPEQDVASREAQELRGELEESTRKRERQKLEDRDLRRTLAHLLNVNTKLLTLVIPRLDELKRKKQ